MKNKFTILLFTTLFFSTFSNAQITTGAGGAASIGANVPTTNNRVGIGTNAPVAILEIASNLPNGIIFQGLQDRIAKSLIFNAGSSVPITNRDPAITLQERLFKFYDFPSSQYDSAAFTQFDIQDRNNSNRLRHTATVNGGSSFVISDRAGKEVLYVGESGEAASLTLPKPNSSITIGGYSPSADYKLMVKNGSSKFEGSVFVDANIGIGTSNFVDGSDTYRLSVKGKIRAEEIKVYNTWADYVFTPNYDLKPLSAVEQYIKQNGHLPNVPSAKEITEKGLALGEMSKIQQEKIEELTLYLIQQNKEIEQNKEYFIQQNKEIEELKAQVKLLMSYKK